MARAKFYIIERSNPQLRKSYYYAKGQKSQKEINKFVNNCSYGSLYIHGAYSTEEEYKSAIENLKEQDYIVY